jgi:hypothetical protein
MDGAVDAAAAEERRFGSVDDGVDGQRGDVSDQDLELRSGNFGADKRSRGLSHAAA